MAGKLLWGWDSTNKVWVPLSVDANGRLKLDMTNISLNDLADVSVASPTDGDFFYYDDATGLWKSKAHVDLTTGVHGVGANYLALTSRSDQYVSYDKVEHWLLPEYILERLGNRRFFQYLFYTYDQIVTAVTGTGTITQNFFQARVGTGANSGSTALQRFSGVHGWIRPDVNSYYFLQAIMATAKKARAFAGMAPADNTVILDTTVSPHAGFLFVKSATENTIYAVNANGTNRTATDTGVTAAGAWALLKIIADATAGEVRFYIGGTLKATHTTNFSTSGMCWKISIISDEAGDNRLHCESLVYSA